MDGKSLFDLLENRIKQGKYTREKATLIYGAWLERHNQEYTEEFGWLPTGELRRMGFTQVNNEWIVPSHEETREVRDSRGQSHMETHAVIDRQVTAYFSSKRAKEMAFRNYQLPVDYHDDSINYEDTVKEIGI